MSRKLKQIQRKAARMLAQGKAQVDTANWLQICPDTLSRWKRNPEFILEMEKVATQLHETMRYRLQHLAEASVSAIWSELNGGSKQLQAALYMLKLLGVERISALDRPPLVQKHPYANDAAFTPAAPTISGEGHST